MIAVVNHQLGSCIKCNLMVKTQHINLLIIIQTQERSLAQSAMLVAYLRQGFLHFGDFKYQCSYTTVYYMYYHIPFLGV